MNYDDNTPIPGYSPRDCGNYLDNNLKLAKIYMKKFKEEVLDNPVAERLNYPQ
ncbi:MAG: S-ribosylhomocysteine lyase [Clostridia bacterium]|nr:S-ribosylhomocysteine lyase [Clostridia bacterium]